ncbi:MAG: HlyD family efflux transporter periplasmic adaptor subunit [Planctomycetota bacterium]
MLTQTQARTAALAAALGFGLALGLAGCGDAASESSGSTRDAQAAAAGQADDHDHDHEGGPLTLMLNRSGREALGIAVAQVEARPRRGAFDLPGRVELLPGARRAAAAPVEGRLSLRAHLLDEVARGDALFALDAPILRDLKASLAEVDAELSAQEAWLAEARELERAHEDHEAALAELVARWERRLTELRALREAAGGQSEALAAAETALVEARSRSAEAREAGAEHHAEVAERGARRAGLGARRAALLGSFAQVLGVELDALTVTDAAGQPAWQALTEVIVRATSDGLVDDVSATDGAWMHAGDQVLGLRRQGELWVRAEALQSELPSLDRATTALARPADAHPGDERRVRVTLAPGLTADAARRTAEVLARFEGAPPEWARPGLAVRIEALVEEPDAGFAVPAAAVRRDGLDRGVWVEDPGAPARLVFVHVEVLAEERGWIWIDDEVHAEHDKDHPEGEADDHDHGPVDAIQATTKVVVRGAGRLLLATRGAVQEGGHFHADGTFHAEAD